MKITCRTKHDATQEGCNKEIERWSGKKMRVADDGGKNEEKRGSWEIHNGRGGSVLRMVWRPEGGRVGQKSQGRSCAAHMQRKTTSEISHKSAKVGQGLQRRTRKSKRTEITSVSRIESVMNGGERMPDLA